MGLAYVAIDKGEGEEARRLLLECLDVFTELADERRVAHCLQGLGTLASEQGDPVEARRRFCDCLSRLSSFLELGTRDGLAQALEAAAVTVSALVGADTGARLLGAAERMREETGTPHAPNERAFFERHARSIQDASKSEMAFRQAWLEGRGLSAEEVLKTALDCLTEAP
jgi:hypothetical protein